MKEEPQGGEEELRERKGSQVIVCAMAVATCYMTTLRVAHSHRATLETQAVRSCRGAASLGARFGALSTVSARSLCASGTVRWTQRRSSGGRIVASAVVEEAVFVSEVESDAESLSMSFKVVLCSEIV